MIDKFFLPIMATCIVIVLIVTVYALMVLQDRDEKCPGLVVKTTKGWTCTDLQKSV